MADKIHIIGRDGCGFSESAKSLVDKIGNKKVTYESIKNNEEVKQNIKKELKLSSDTTFPIAHFYWKSSKDNQKKCIHIGGYSEFNSIYEKEINNNLSRKIWKRVLSM